MGGQGTFELGSNHRAPARPGIGLGEGASGGGHGECKGPGVGCGGDASMSQGSREAATGWKGGGEEVGLCGAG